MLLARYFRWVLLYLLPGVSFCQSQPQLNANIVSLRLQSVGNTLDNSRIISSKEKQEVKNVVTILTNRLLNSNSIPDEVFLQNLNDDISILTKITTKNQRDSVTNYYFNEVLEDLQVKAFTETGTLVDNFDFLVTVKVITRELKEGKFTEVNGYRIFANPVVFASTAPPKIIFTNTTNPFTIEKIPPGKYFFWAQSLTDNKIYPIQLDPTRVRHTTNSETIIYLDIIHDTGHQ